MAMPPNHGLRLAPDRAVILQYALQTYILRPLDLIVILSLHVSVRMDPGISRSQIELEIGPRPTPNSHTYLVIIVLFRWNDIRTKSSSKFSVNFNNFSHGLVFAILNWHVNNRFDF